jgi:hypothetical protein
MPDSLGDQIVALVSRSAIKSQCAWMRGKALESLSDADFTALSDMITAYHCSKGEPGGSSSPSPDAAVWLNIISLMPASSLAQWIATASMRGYPLAYPAALWLARYIAADLAQTAWAPWMGDDPAPHPSGD